MNHLKSFQFFFSIVFLRALSHIKPGNRSNESSADSESDKESSAPKKKKNSAEAKTERNTGNIW